MSKKVIITATILGATAIMLGAFGAHGLKKLVDAEGVNTFEVGVKYQMYHALFLLFIGLSPLTDKQKKVVQIMTIVGVVGFSGSIYGLVTNHLQSFFDFKKIALVTPLGGMFLIIAWVMTFVFFIKKDK